MNDVNPTRRNIVQEHAEPKTRVERGDAETKIIRPKKPDSRVGDSDSGLDLLQAKMHARPKRKRGYVIDANKLPSVKAEELPDYIRPLLDHRKTMTSVLEKNLNGGRALEVERFYEPTYDGKRLSRLVLLKDPKTQSIKSVGVIIINVEALKDKPGLLQEVSEENIPFGRLLKKYGIPAEGEPQDFYKITDPVQKHETLPPKMTPEQSAAFAITDHAVPLYGRRNRLYRTDVEPRQKIASVFEFICPQALRDRT